MTPLPVIGVPVALKHLDGLDSLLSIVQMPAGVPVATVAVGNARNAGLLAVRILAATDPALQQRMVDFQQSLKDVRAREGRRRRAASDGSASDDAAPAARLVGLDVARALALLGMVATHMLPGARRGRDQPGRTTSRAAGPRRCSRCWPGSRSR